MNKVITNELLSKGFVVVNGKWSYKGKKMCVIDFYADWCQPCKPQETVLDELSKKYDEIEFLKVNVEEEYELAEIFSIKSLPTVIICGKENSRFSGFTSSQKVEDAIKNQIEIFV